MCKKLKTIEIPNSVTTIEDNAFYYCTALKTVKLSENIKSIPSYCFNACASLTSIEIPAGVTNIGGLAFNNCTNLKTVTFKGDCPTMVKQPFYNSNKIKDIYVPCEYFSNYKNSTGLTDAQKLLLNRIETISEDIYIDCDCHTYADNITIKSGASLAFTNYSNVAAVLAGKTINVERTLPVDKWSLLGNISSTQTYAVLDNNIGTATSQAHAISAAPYDYTTNQWSGTYAYYKDATPKNYGSFFVWPHKEKWTDNGQDGEELADNYITLMQTIAAEDLNFSDVIFEGIKNQGDDYNSAKWFALSNPFLGKLRLDKFYSTNIGGQIQGTNAYVWSSAGDWTEVDMESADMLYPATGFMVAGTDAQPAFAFAYDMTAYEDISATTYKSAKTDKIIFTATANGIEKKVYAKLDENATNGFDIKDSYVMFSSNEDSVNPYFVVENKDLLENRFNQLPYVADLCFNSYKSNTIDFALTSVNEDIQVSLIDVMNDNKETVLTADEPITLTVDKGSNEGRYKIKFADKKSSVITAENSAANISTWNNGRKITVSGENLSKAEIINTLGQTVHTQNLAVNGATFDTHLTDGAYIIKVYNKSNAAKTAKIIIK
ncbi:MAG: leucine-rich repeat domain-containing protein [Bacteroidales bacterium]|nr:leucine-rich repeat domain-containing protein [Bacteroidales bacterium]